MVSVSSTHIFLSIKNSFLWLHDNDNIAAILHDISNDIQNIPKGKFHFRDIFSDKGNWNTQESSEKSKLVFKRWELRTTCVHTYILPGNLSRKMRGSLPLFWNTWSCNVYFKSKNNKVHFYIVKYFRWRWTKLFNKFTHASYAFATYSSGLLL